MNKMWTCLALAAAMACAPVCLAGGTDVPPPPAKPEFLAADLVQIMEWFPGRFDNNRQVVDEEEAGVETPLLWIHSIFEPVELPEFGDHVFYVEQYQEGDPAKIYRQRIYSWSVDEQEQAVRLDIYRPKDAAPLVGAHEDHSKLEGLTKDQAVSLPGCEVYWRRQDDHYIGYMKEKACSIVSQRGPNKGKTIYITDTLYLDDDEIWIHDEAFLEDGTRVWGDDRPHKLYKASLYDCWAVLEKNRNDAVENEGKEWVTFMGLELHDQGGRALLTPADGGETEYAVQLEQLTFRGRRGYVDVLKIGLEDLETGKTLRYGWAEPGSDVVGFNLRWFQIGCTAR